jgi:type IV pilus assembly protein PilX
MYNKLLIRFRSLQVSTVEDPIINNSLISGITHHQSGAVLIISLVILLLLTLIGASSIQTSNLEEKMAGNLRDRDFAFQAAESALIDAETKVTLCVVISACSISTADVIKDSFWTTIPKGSQNNIQCIEQSPDCPSSGYSIFTVRATGGSTNTVVILQTIYSLVSPCSPSNSAPCRSSWQQLK